MARGDNSDNLIAIISLILMPFILWFGYVQLIKPLFD